MSNQTTLIRENGLDLLIYKLVAKHNGASNFHEEILDSLKARLSPTKCTRILKGSANIDRYDIRTIHEVMVSYDPQISMEDIMKAVEF